MRGSIIRIIQLFDKSARSPVEIRDFTQFQRNPQPVKRVFQRQDMGYAGIVVIFLPKGLLYGLHGGGGMSGSASTGPRRMRKTDGMCAL